MIKEFKEFAMKGNMMDMAVGIIIGGAFGGIVQSLIKDVVMPVVGIAGNVDFSNMFIPLSKSAKDAVEAAKTTGAPLSLDDARAAGSVLAYGNFVTVFVNFIILAFVIFMIIKMMNKAKATFEKEQEAAAPAAPPAQEVLLAEIRDLLANKA
ncbi:MAG: large conductance mechanosensitive channel protein MscL [Phycisphaeraceae bacterium]|nr:large conductance mechanosensitive channel protein MscL [Phycisphaeraceae bacterium]